MRKLLLFLIVVTAQGGTFLRAQQPEAGEVPRGPSAEIIIDDDVLGDTDTVYEEVMPTFGRKKQNLNDFHAWVMRTLKYPMEESRSPIAYHIGEGKPRYKLIDVEGMVLATFIIQKDGRLSNIEIVFSPDKRLSDEVIRVLRRSPKWTPGTLNGEPIRAKFTIPVVFSLN